MKIKTCLGLGLSVMFLGMSLVFSGCRVVETEEGLMFGNKLVVTNAPSEPLLDDKVEDKTPSLNQEDDKNPLVKNEEQPEDETIGEISSKNEDEMSNEKTSADGEITGSEVPSVEENNIELLINERTIRGRETKGIYIRGSLFARKSNIEKLFELIDETGINTVVVDIKDDEGKLLFPMSNEKITKFYNSSTHTDSIDYFMQGCKERNLYTIGRVTSFCDTVAANSFNSLSMAFEDGTLYSDHSNKKWIDPYKKDVLLYILSIAEETAKKGFDEVNFDYVRFPVDEGYSNIVFGDGTVPMYDKQTMITLFAKQAVDSIHKLGVLVSFDVFGIVISSESDARNLGQNYVDLTRELDFICPMIYPSHYANGYAKLVVPDAKPYDLVEYELKKSAAKLEDAEIEAVKVRPWLQAFTADWVEGHIEYDSVAINKQIKASAEAGLGWLLWNSSGNYSKDIWNQ
ncbi:MAG: putative glycoside hydrolase [Lachnospiraceae bacterium]|nr:putative glycoside hydrolase [Lachnospiraceae bacterium]